MKDQTDKLILRILELHDQGKSPAQISASLTDGSEEAVLLLRIISRLEMLKYSLPSPAAAFAKTLALLSNPQPEPEKKRMFPGYNIFRRKRSSPA